jgi:hypothetical protein
MTCASYMRLCRARCAAAQDCNGQRYVKAERAGAHMDKAADELLVYSVMSIAGSRGASRGSSRRVCLWAVSGAGSDSSRWPGEARLEGRDISAHGERERAGLADY